MTTQKLGQSRRKVNSPISGTIGRYSGQVLRSAELDAELKSKGKVSLAERKIIEFLTPLLAAGPVQVSHKEIIKGAKIYAASMTPAIRRAIEHEFLCRDETTKPHTWRLHERWFTSEVS